MTPNFMMPTIARTVKLATIETLNPKPEALNPKP